MQQLTQKQENFCQAVLTEANTSDAYRSAYACSRMKMETINRNAKALMDDNKIATRLKTLRAKVTDKTLFTAERIARGLEQARVQALEDHQNSAAVSAGLGLAKLFGLLEDKLTIKGQVTAETGIDFLSSKYGIDVAKQIEESDEDTKH